MKISSNCSLGSLFLRVFPFLSFFSFVRITHLLEPLSVGSSDEVGLHVVDAPLWVHQVLVVFTLDLNHPHNDSVDHVD